MGSGFPRLEVLIRLRAESSHDLGGFSWWVASERAIYNLMVLVAEARYVPEGVKLLKASTNRVECVIVIVRCKADVQAVAPAILWSPVAIRLEPHGRPPRWSQLQSQVDDL